MKYKSLSFLASSLLGALCVCVAFDAAGQEFNPTGWGKCAPTPAVVNPAVVSPLQKIVSLKGAWDFKTDENGWGTLTAVRTFGDIPEDFWDDARSLNVPGCWEAQGVGTPGISETWDCKWDCNPRPLEHIYSGVAIYRKKVEIPQDWKDSRVWLKVGGVRTEAKFIVNSNSVGTINNYCGTYKFDVTDFVTPGEEAELIAFVRNDIPSRKGQMCDYHKFGGFYRDVELEATPQTWLDDVWVQGQISESGKDFGVQSSSKPTRTARVHTTIKTAQKNESVELDVTIKSVDGETLASKTVKVEPTNAQEAELVVDVPVENVALWTPENPNLYLADVKIANKSDGTKHGWIERFGFRKFEKIGKRFFFNGVPFFIRGYGETFIYPETLVSPADRDVHRKNFAIIKESGFNETRMHTHCELPEYFEAADEAGVLIQPELPYYSSVPCEGFDFDPMLDLQELYRHYRRYTSFMIYCMGNEGGFDEETNQQLYRWVKENDPDRVCQLQDGGANSPENSDFLTRPIMPWEPGAFDGEPYPFVAHEYLNLTVKLDPRLEPLFTGAIPPLVSIKDYEARLEELGLTREWGDACIRAAGRLQAYLQKEGLESARRDPECDGYCFWNFIDQMVIQNGVYTSQGYMNAFYQVKDGGITPKEFAKFNSSVAILPLFDSVGDIFVAGQTVPLNVMIANFGFEPLESGKLEWRLEPVGAEDLAVEGEAPFERFEIGDARVAATVDVTIPNLPKAAELKLTVKIAGTEFENNETVWGFPKRETLSLAKCLVAPEFFEWFNERYEDVEAYDPNGTQDANKTLIASFGTESYEQGVKEGRKILAIRPTDGNNNFSLGWWSFGAQLGTAFADSPAFGDFPHKNAMVPSLWYRMIKDDPMPVSEVVGEYKPLALGELLHDYAIYVGEKEENGAKILAVFGLNVMQDLPEAQALLDGFIQYVSKY